jgi:hypothetical protein
MKEFMELVEYRITEGSGYHWECYGHDAYMLDSWNSDQDGHSFTIIFDTKDQTVYEVQAHDYLHNRAYRMINPDFQKKNRKEARRRDINLNQAWDNIDYVDLDIDDDFIQKALAIRAGEDYDTRVSVPLELDDATMFQMMRMAHERDLTLNEFVEQVLRHAIEEKEALSD